MQETSSRVSPIHVHNLGCIQCWLRGISFYIVIHTFLIAAIERNLESEEQERVSADMRIRKSQVGGALC